MNPSGKGVRTNTLAKTFFVLLAAAAAWLFIPSLKYAREKAVENIPPRGVEYRLALREAGSRFFLLDSLTDPPSIAYYQYFTDAAGKKYLTFLNNQSHTIYYYDYPGGRLARRVRLKEYGYTGSDKIQGYHILNADSLFVYNYSNSGLTLLSLRRGPLLRRTISERAGLSRQTVFPVVATTSPIAFEPRRAKVYLAGYMSHEGGPDATDRERNVLATFHLGNGAVQYGMQYPEFYWGTNWGGTGGFRQPFFDYNPGDHRLVFSFMADHHLSVLDAETGQRTRHYAGSRHFGEIKSMKYRPIYHDFLSQTELYRYYSQNPSYLYIIYDPFRQVYYRVAELPARRFNARVPKHLSKQKAVIILDRSFRKRGEVVFPPDAYDFSHFFVAEDGLHVRKLRHESDDRVTFQRLELVDAGR